MHRLIQKDEEAYKAALRASLQVELKNKKQCSYQSYECSQLSLDGFDYCNKHILSDKNSPFKQCNYTYASNGKRCNLPAITLKTDKKDHGYCSEHALKATLTKNKQNAKLPPPHTPEALLSSLTHYIKKPRTRTTSQQSDEGSSIIDDLELKSTKSLDPFVDVNAANLLTNRCNEILGYCSESESDTEPATLGNVWHDANMDSSDDESIDSDCEDPLKHANVYTAEEITLIARDKLIKLQSLYIEEYRYLQHLLKEKRRKYLHSLRREKETCCNIYNQIRDNPKEQRLYKKLKVYNKYHKTHGVEAICNKRMHELRTKITDGIVHKPPSYTKCMFTEGGVKCGERTLPLARHCRKHILEDPNQVLFRSCGRVKADLECNTPVEAIFEDASCRLHADIPIIRSYSHHRKDSESDYDEPINNSALISNLLESNAMNLSSLVNLKSELKEFDVEKQVKMESLPSILFEGDENDEETKEMYDDIDELKNENDEKETFSENVDKMADSNHDVKMETDDFDKRTETDLNFEMKNEEENCSLENLKIETGSEERID